MALEPTDGRTLNGKSQADQTADYYVRSGILGVIQNLQSVDWTQEEIADYLTENGYQNSFGLVSWTQASVCKILQRARRRGDIF